MYFYKILAERGLQGSNTLLRVVNRFHCWLHFQNKIGMIQSPAWPMKSFKIILRFLVWCPQNDCWYGTPTSYWTFKIQSWIYISSNLIIPSSLFPAPTATQVGQSLANLVTKAGCREKEGVDILHPWPVQCKHPAGKGISKVCQSLLVQLGRGGWGCPWV